MKNRAVAIADDDGYTRKPFKSVTRTNACPDDLTEMADGTVVLRLQQKHDRPGGKRAMISRDGGAPWDRTRYMLGWYGGLGPQDAQAASSSVGHSSSVTLRDGGVLTLCNGFSSAANALITDAVMWTPLESDHWWGRHRSSAAAPAAERALERTRVL